MRMKIEFTNFAMAILLFAGFAVAAINVNTGENVEIAGFIESESQRILQIPDTLVLNLNFQTAKDGHSRAGLLFFLGEREVSIKMDYALGQLKGTLKADTSWFTGYCGMLECQTKPMPAQQRIEVTRILVSRILMDLKRRIQGVFVENVPIKTETAPTDTIPPQDTIPQGGEQ
ncbi:MAG: hypothetical protein FWC15_02895 [Fibromonadales bacterium]|nr:hypothetical protein [Fibromonadales bacterium]